MASLPAVAVEEGDAALPHAAALPKEAAFGAEAGGTVRRPGRLRVMHPHVAEFLRSPRRHARASAAAKDPHARRPPPPQEPPRYACAFEADEDGAVAAPGRLVWGKVRHHPWWPGQVFHAAEASAAALAHRRPRRALLVAYFWDRSFAWNHEAALRPFRAAFPRLASHARGGTAAFAAAVDAALGEVARRVGTGLSCCCGDKGEAASATGAGRQVIDNAGVREAAYGAPVDVVFARNALRAEALVEYVAALAAAPLAGAHRVDLAVAKAQLEAFGRWKGCARGLPEYAVVHGIDGVASKAATKRRRSSTGGGGGGGKRRSIARGNAACDGGDYEALEQEDFPRPTPQQMSTKMGKLMSRAAQQMSLSPVILRGANGKATPPHMTRCAGAGDDPPPVNNGKHARGAVPVEKRRPAARKEASLQAGLLLNFVDAGAVPSATHLTMIFSRFGPVKEVRVENTSAVVVFKKGAHADKAFSGTAKISSISPSLISFRITYSPPAVAAPVDPPQNMLLDLDPLPAEALQ